ncbi:MAG: tetratricopeptide repeat protein [Bacteroidota bacterium]
MARPTTKKDKQPQAPAAPVKMISDKWLGLLCALLALLLYANTIGHDYTVDDGTVIKNNKQTVAGIKSLPAIFSSAYRAGYWDRKEGLYRPLSVAMFAIEWQIAPDQPWLGHLINILLYILTAWCLFHFLRQLLASYHYLVPFIITILYIAHPLHTEVVANIKSRDEILCFLFSILAMHQLVKWLSSGKTLTLVFAAVLYMLALLSKESAITLIFIFPLITWFFSKDAVKRLPATIFTFLFTGLFFIGLRYAVIHAVTGNYELQLINNTLIGTQDYMIRFGTAIMIMGKYLFLLFIPYNLVFDYSYNTIPLTSLFSPAALLSFALYIIIAWIAIKGFREKKSYSFGIFFFAITVSLVSNILFLIEATMAERFLYMPSLGFCIAIVTGAESLIKKSKNVNGTLLKQLTGNPAYLVFTIAVLLFSVRTIARNSQWKNNITLLAADVKTSPNSARIRYAYGSAILIEQALKEEDKNKKQQLLQASIAELEKGVSIIADYADAWYHLGVAYKEAEDPVNAIRCFEKSKSYKPFKTAEAYIAEGLAYGMAHQNEKAITELQNALKLDSISFEAFNNLGLYYNDAGHTQESINALQKAIALNPDFSKAYYNLGNTYAKAGDYTTAIKHYQKAVSLESNYGDAYNNIGNCYATMQMRDSARVYYEKAVVADPSNSKAVINVGIIHSQMGDTAGAKIWFEKARALGAAI